MGDSSLFFYKVSKDCGLTVSLKRIVYGCYTKSSLTSQAMGRHAGGALRDDPNNGVGD